MWCEFNEPFQGLTSVPRWRCAWNQGWLLQSVFVNLTFKGIFQKICALLSDKKRLDTNYKCQHYYESSRNSDILFDLWESCAWTHKAITLYNWADFETMPLFSKTMLWCRNSAQRQTDADDRLEGGGVCQKRPIETDHYRAGCNLLFWHSEKISDNKWLQQFEVVKG